MKLSTKCLHSGYNPADGEPGAIPIIQSTTFRFEKTETLAALFDMPTAHIYSRISNPTTAIVEEKIADLEGGAACMCTSSGQAATLLAVLNLCSAGDSVVSNTALYGGVANLLGVTLKRFGIECIFVDLDAPAEEIEKAIKPNTKLIYGETIANPVLSVLDFDKLSKIANKHGIPFMVDNTFATPALCRPLELGADIVVHSTSKYMDGHAIQVGGAIIESGKFNYENGKFPDFCTPDPSYHGLTYTKDFAASPFIAKARLQLMRDFGATPSPHSMFLLNLGLETLAVRMEKYCQNAMAVAEFLSKHEKISAVRYPGLVGDKYYSLAQKYLPEGSSGVLSVDVSGGREKVAMFCDALKLVCREIHVSDIRSCVLHPASTTHRQMDADLLKAAGVSEGLVRLSVGLEDVSDIIADLEQALAVI